MVILLISLTFLIIPNICQCTECTAADDLSNVNQQKPIKWSKKLLPAMVAVTFRGSEPAKIKTGPEKLTLSSMGDFTDQ